MAKLKIEGSFVALITPFNRDGSVDLEGFRTLMDFQYSHGTSALLIMGSTGEVSMLSVEERHTIITETVKYRKGDMLLFYGCTGNTTQSTIDMVRYAANEGADGAIITVPSYICPPVEDAVAYCLEVADATDLPLGIYNNPGRVGTDLPAEAIIRLADHPNIVVNKEATARPGQIAQIAAARKELSLMCCDSPHLGLVMQVMSLGGQGTAEKPFCGCCRCFISPIPGSIRYRSNPWPKPWDSLRVICANLTATSQGPNSNAVWRS
jgi:4-hydroxy-tetrahydrodipicolinate synthase